MENDFPYVRNELERAPAPRKAGLQLPAWAHEGVAVCVPDVHEEMQMRADNQVRRLSLALAAGQLRPDRLGVDSTAASEPGLAAHVFLASLRIADNSPENGLGSPAQLSRYAASGAEL